MRMECLFRVGLQVHNEAVLGILPGGSGRFGASEVSGGSVGPGFGLIGFGGLPDFPRVSKQMGVPENRET